MASADKIIWSYGDSKKDRKGRSIIFVGYSAALSFKGDKIELWEPESIFIKRGLNESN